ncbi:YfiR family protein [Pseudomonas citronellolis]|nr:YfiR family protein [Pseudomonas citronellolis]MDF3933745.1 YfiR family protein [Pseudomonas citronellolis]
MPLTAPATRRLTLLHCLAALFSGALATASCLADEAASGERDQAVEQMLLSILSYVRWPREPEQLALCVLGPTRYAGALLAQGELRQASGRRIEVRRRELDDPELVSQCDVAYLGELDAAQRQRMVERLAGHPVLSIDEENPQCSLGGMFCLVFDERRPSFLVNLDSVARSEVRVHPSVLNLGRRRGKP